VTSGLAAIPILLAKLWSVIPKLFEWPPVRSVAHGLERLGLALLVGGSLFVFFTGVINIQVYYPWAFSFVPAHYYASFVFLGALGLHLATKLGVIRRAYRERGVTRPLRDDLAATRAEPSDEAAEITASGKSTARFSTAPLAPATPTISRRGLLGAVGLGSALLGVMAAAQAVGGPVRALGVLVPRGRSRGSGPNDFQVNKTASAAGLGPKDVGADWRLKVGGARAMELSREDLLSMPQATHDLPIACVEGWSTTETWTGVPLRDIARLAGMPDGSEVLVESFQRTGGFTSTTLSDNKVSNPKSLLALKVNGADLSLDHGFPARVIVPGLPGVRNIKWVGSLSFGPGGLR
jgi:DMSO/TMAO reductase YedYZ molybdopterin-dependent catalytic subunit